MIGLEQNPQMEALLDGHIALRDQRQLQTAMRRAHLPTVKTLGERAFTFQPSIRRDQLEIFDTLQYPERKDTVVLLGAPPTVHNSCRCRCVMLLASSR